jgi:hypothetical protein
MVWFTHVYYAGCRVMIPEDPNNEWLRYLAFTSLAAIGGVLGYIMRTIDARMKLNWWHVLLQGAAAGFVGLLSVLVCEELNLSMAWTGVAAGLLGWLGANASAGLLSKLLLKKLGISPQEQPLREREDDIPKLD